MAYTALKAMQEKNYALYHDKFKTQIGPKQPTLEKIADEDLDLKAAAIRFLHESCEGLRFKYDGKVEDAEGISGKKPIPYDMQMDLDRLCLEKSLERFIDSGTANDAFDVYFCYMEMFLGSYGKSSHMIEMLSEFESNASSLLMKHRDHYSHSVYVFALGLAIYETNSVYREAYAKFYGFDKLDPHQAAHHFLKYWGLSALFHDIGYPFELPFEQVCAYFEEKELAENGKKIERDGIPFMAYQDLGNFIRFSEEENKYFSGLCGAKKPKYKNSNELFAKLLEAKLGEKYHFTKASMQVVLDTKPVNPNRFGYFMDHAYFSATILLKELLEELPLEEISMEHLDALTAILLHNSLYKFSIAFYKEDTLNKTIQPQDHPLAYMLMLCDELQCWDRTAYGRNSRTELHPMGCDFRFVGNGIQANYIYDLGEKDKIDAYNEAYAKYMAIPKEERGNAKAPSLKAYASMVNDNSFRTDIERIVDLKNGISLSVTTELRKADHSSKKLYLSNSNFIHLYRFAVAMNAQYSELKNTEEMDADFNGLSLEYKLSNIAQVKEFAIHMHEIHCFYTDRPVDFELVENFTEEELLIIGKSEHARWENEKRNLSWISAGDMVEALNQDRVLRECARMHYDLDVRFEDLSREEQLKDQKPLNTMLEKLKEFDGVRIYRVAN